MTTLKSIKEKAKEKIIEIQEAPDHTLEDEQAQLVELFEEYLDLAFKAGREEERKRIIDKIKGLIVPLCDSKGFTTGEFGITQDDFYKFIKNLK